MPSLLDSPSPLPAAGAWGSLYAVQESVKPRHMFVPAAAMATKKQAYGGRKKNLETCTEALGCETGGVDAALAGNGAGSWDGGVEAECAERKRRAREEEEETVAEGRARRSGRRPLPPPLTTLARGASRVRMVHERRDGQLEVYAVCTPGILEAERSGGRLLMRLLPLPGGAGNAAAAAACGRQEPQRPEAEEEEAKEAQEEAEEEYGFAKYVRGSRCVEPEGGAAAARRGKQWEPEQTAVFWVATS